jgi:hypothetical protein
LLDHVIALDHMQRLGVRRAVAVERRKVRNRDPDRIDDEGVAFIMADGIAIP